MPARAVSARVVDLSRGFPERITGPAFMSRLCLRLSHFSRQRAHVSLIAPLVALAALAASTPSRADDPTNIRAPEVRTDDATHWGVGLGAGLRRRPYTGVKNETRALPLIYFENKYARFAGTGLDIKLPSAGPVTFAARVRYGFDGYKQFEAPALVGMNERKASIWLGGVAFWRTDIAVLSAEAVTDVSGRSKGSQFRIGADREFRTGGFSFTPHVAATWLDHKYVDYYFGVRTDEATIARRSYAPGSTVNTEIGLRTGFALAPNQLVTLDVGTTLYGSAIKDSPIVGRSSSPSVRAGYLYRF
jgi:outer membrane protein